MEQISVPALLISSQEPGIATLGRRCEVRTLDGVTVVVVDETVLMSFDAQDVAARRLAMVMLSDRQVANHDQIAAAFGVKSLAVDRARKAFREHGIEGLVAKKRGPKGPRLTGGKTATLILVAKRAGQSNKTIALGLGISASSVVGVLRRLGWEPQRSELLPAPEPLPAPESLPAPEPLPVPEPLLNADRAEAAPVAASADADEQVHASKPCDSASESTCKAAIDLSLPAETTADTDPSNRTIDRFLAVQGLLEDAAPLFGQAQGIRDVGALLAIPVMVTQGVFFDAMQSFRAIGPAFYGLRTTIVCVALLMMLNLCRPQHVMQREPRSLGRLVGLDRSPEVKTLRRKVNVLAAQKKSLFWMELLARRVLAKSDDDVIWAYLDGHVSVYSGDQPLRQHHVTRLRTSRPSVIDYWVNQPNGDPLMVITGAPKESMVAVIETVVDKIRALAPGKRLVLVFDREGWSPKLFARLAQIPNVFVLTYRKSSPGKRLPKLAASDFQEHEWKFDGRTFNYQLADNRVQIGYMDGREPRILEMRQLTRLKKDGKQTHILTNDFDGPAAGLAHRMFARWVQENYFKYGSEHRDIDALVTHDMESADGSRLVTNPERAPIDKELSRLRAELQKIHEHYGRTKLASNPPPSAGEETYGELTKQLEVSIAQCQSRRNALPAKVPWSTTEKGKNAVQPRVEHRRLMHGFRMVSHRAETALLELIRPHFADWRREGRSLLRQILHSSGDLNTTASHLHVTIEPLASPYKTRALAALCEEINKLDTTFPGSQLKMAFRVRPEAPVS